MYNILTFHPVDGYVGLWQSDSESWQRVEVGHAKDVNVLLVALNVLTRESGVPLAKVTHIGVMPGPGSYTQIRVYVATANTLAWSLGKPLFAISQEAQMPEALLECIAHARVNQPVDPVYPTTIE